MSNPDATSSSPIPPQLLVAVVCDPSGEVVACEAMPDTPEAMVEEVTNMATRIFSHVTSRTTVSDDSISYHVDFDMDGRGYLLAVTNNTSRSVAFECLTAMKARGSNLLDAAMSFGDDAPDENELSGREEDGIARDPGLTPRTTQHVHAALGALLRQYQSHKLLAVQAEVERTKAVAIDAVEAAIERGERMPMLQQKGEDLASSATSFHRTSRDFSYQFGWRRYAAQLWLAAFIIIVVILFVKMVCSSTGGFNMHHC